MNTSKYTLVFANNFPMAAIDMSTEGALSALEILKGYNGAKLSFVATDSYRQYSTMVAWLKKDV